MDSLSSCLLLTSILALALGKEEQREMPTIAMSQTTRLSISSSTATSNLNCSLVFDYIGPFCQYVYHYQSGFSLDTINTCMDIMHTCGSLDGNAEDICLSRLSPYCADPVQNDVIMEYCGVVQVACPGGFSGSGSSASGNSGSAEIELPSMSSGSASASGSGASGIPSSSSGSSSGDSIGTGGNPGQPDNGSGSGELPDISDNSGQPDSGTGSGQSESGGSPGHPDNDTVLLTTVFLPHTTMIPNVLVNFKELSELQRENIVTIIFRGLNEEQFVRSGIKPFRQEVVRIINTYLFNKGNNRQKRQQTPLTSEDVLIIEPLVEDQGRLQVSFVVGGEGGQSTLISRSVLSSLLEAKGQQLAADLSAASNLNVQFAGIIPTKSHITTTSPTTTQLSTTVTGTVIIQSTVDNGRQEQPILSAGAVAGVVVIGVLFAVLSLLLLTIAVASYRALSRRRQYKMRSGAQCNKHVEVPVEGDGDFVPTRQPLAEENNCQAVPVSDEMQEDDLATKEP